MCEDIGSSAFMYSYENARKHLHLEEKLTENFNQPLKDHVFFLVEFSANFSQKPTFKTSIANFTKCTD